MVLIYMAIGLFSGLFGSIMGFGISLLVSVCCVAFLELNQHHAHAMGLAVTVIPFGILGVMNYAQSGFLDWQKILWIGIGIGIGAFFGTKIAITFDEVLLNKIYSFALLTMSVYILYKSHT